MAFGVCTRASKNGVLHSEKGNSSMKLINRLNGILELFTIGPYRSIRDRAHRIFGLHPEHSLLVEGEDVAKFDSAIDDLLASMPGVAATLSTEKLVEQLIPEVLKKKTAGAKFTEAESDSFEQSILHLPVQEYRILRAIYGITLTPGGPPVSMGDFTIYDPKAHSREIARGRPGSALLDRAREQEGFLIECPVHARDSTKAEQLADTLFYRFELIFRFLIGQRTTRYEVGVLNYVGPQLRNSIVAGGNEVISGSAWKGALEPIQMADPFYSSPSPPFARLLRLISAQRNPIEIHVMRCAEWTGEAIGDPNAASAFVKAATALEVLFSADEKGVITRSIMAQIAESCAFLLGVSAANAAEIERKVKDLYSIRSAIVHSGKDSVRREDLDVFIHICRSAVITLLSRREFEDIGSMSKLAGYFRERRYASLGLAPQQAHV